MIVASVPYFNRLVSARTSATETSHPTRRDETKTEYKPSSNFEVDTHINPVFAS
jgi:hypothetical protein